jgi:hypothetical protein
VANLVDILFRASGGGQVSGETAKVQSGLSSLKGGVNSFLGGMKQLDSTMASFGVGIGLMSLVTSAKQWTEEAIAGAAVEARLTRTFTNVAGGAGLAAGYLTAMTTATKNQVEQDALMAVGLDVINLGLAKTPAQMEQYVAVSKRLGAEFGAMGFDEAVSGFNRVMEAGSVSARFLLNYGISADNVKARIVELQRANASLSDTDAARQAIMAEAVATYERLGPVQRDTISAQKELTAAQKDFQDAFGATLLQLGNSTGIFDAATQSIRRLQGGAEAWTAYSQQTQAGGDALRTTQQNLIASTNSLDEYNAAVTRAIQEAGPLAQIFGIGRGLYLQKNQYDAMKAGLDEASGGMRQASGDAGVYMVKLGSAAATTKGFTVDTGTAARALVTFSDKLDLAAKRADLARASFQKARTWQVDYGALYDAEAASETSDARTRATRIANIQAISQFEISERERVESEGAKFAEDAQKESERKTKEAYDSLRSTIEGVMQPTLSEVYKPPPGFEQRIDEDARRLADVVKLGGKSPWAEALAQKYAGAGWWQPMADAIASGNRDAMQAAGAAILANPALMTSMWDVPTIVQKTKDALAAQGAREQIIQAVMAELSGQGIAVNAGEVSAIMGGGGTAGLAGMLTGNLATDMPGAIGSSGASASMLNALKDGVNKSDKEVVALASAIAGGLDKAWASVTKTTAASLIAAIVTEVKTQLGATHAATAAAGGPRP